MVGPSRSTDIYATSDASGWVPPTPKSTSGVQGDYANGELTIEHIIKNSPAEMTGLKEGDQIYGLNGTPLLQQLADSHWGRAASGTRYAVELCDGTCPGSNP